MSSTACLLDCLFVFLFVCFERQREREGERESQSGSTLAVQSQIWGSKPQTMRLGPEPKTKSQMLNWLSYPGAPSTALLDHWPVSLLHLVFFWTHLSLFFSLVTLFFISVISVGYFPIYSLLFRLSLCSSSLLPSLVRILTIVTLNYLSGRLLISVLLKYFSALVSCSLVWNMLPCFLILLDSFCVVFVCN